MASHLCLDACSTFVNASSAFNCSELKNILKAVVAARVVLPLLPRGTSSGCVLLIMVIEIKCESKNKQIDVKKRVRQLTSIHLIRAGTVLWPNYIYLHTSSFPHHLIHGILHPVIFDTILVQTWPFPFLLSQIVGMPLVLETCSWLSFGLPQQSS